MASSDLVDFGKLIKEVSAELRVIATKLDSSNLGKLKGQFTGSILTAVGTALCIAGCIATFCTAGLAAPLVPVGNAVAASGALVTVATLVAEKFISADALQKAERLYGKLLKHPGFAVCVIDEKYFSSAGDEIQLDKQIKLARRNGVTLIKTSIKIGSSGGRNLLKCVKGVILKAGVANAVFLPMAIKDLVESSVNLYLADGTSRAGNHLRDTADALDSFASST